MNDPMNGGVVDDPEFTAAVEPGFRPSTGIYSEKYADVAEKIKATPGVWHRFLICDNGPQAQIRAADVRRGRIRAFRPKGAWEAATQSNCVMVRYVGAFAPSPESPAVATGGVVDVSRAVEQLEHYRRAWLRRYPTAFHTSRGRTTDARATKFAMTDAEMDAATDEPGVTVYTSTGSDAGIRTSAEDAAARLTANGYQPRPGQPGQWVALRPDGNLFASVVADDPDYTWRPNHGKATPA